MTKEDDPRGILLCIAQAAVFAGIEQVEEGAKGLVFTMVGESDGMHCLRKPLVQVPRQACLAVGKISGVNASAHEANYKEMLRRRGD
jgi:hypothetical protein